VLFSIIVVLVVVFVNYAPYPSPLMCIAVKAEWNDICWALNGSSSYEEISFAIRTVGTFEA